MIIDAGSTTATLGRRRLSSAPTAAGDHRPPAATASNGVLIQGGATGNTIGGTTAAARNVISGNAVCGVYLIGQGTSGNVVEGDYIGTNADRQRRAAQPHQRCRHRLRGVGQHHRRDHHRRPQRHLGQHV